MELHFIVNEQSGNGKGKKTWLKFKNQLTIPFIEHITQYSGHALQISQTISDMFLGKEKFALIVAVGGDGTIHEVLNGAKSHRNLFIGFVKAGSGNDFSRAYPTFQTAHEIEQFMKNPWGNKMDCGQILIDHKIVKKFVNNAGIGFDALVAKKANQSITKGFLNKIGLGKLSYGISTIIALFTFKRFKVEVVVDGKQYAFQKTWFVTVSNQPYFGGGMKLSPNSKTNDGELEITIVHNLPHMNLLFLFGSVFTGKHTKLSYVTQLKGRQFNVHLAKPLYIHADGEIIGTTENRNNIITYQILKESWISVDLNRNSTQLLEI